MLKKIRNAAITLILVSCCVASVFPDEVLTPRQKGAQDALLALKAAFEEENTVKFFSLVSDDPYFDYADFKIRIIRRFADFSQMQLFWTADDALTESDKASIRVRWQSRMINSRTGKAEMNKGSTQFIFKLNDKARLVDIKGDYPF